MAASFRRIAILGTGLIGGSFGLALRKYAPDTVVVGWDKGHVLRHALERGAIHEGLPEIARLASPDALVTDASSTKRSVCAVAAECFREGGARFLGGHPMAGK